MYIYYVNGNVTCLSCSDKVTGVIVQTRLNELSPIPRCDYCDVAAAEEETIPNAMSLEQTYNLTAPLAK